MTEDHFATVNNDILDNIKLEIHYFLRDQSHSLNAFVMNRSQYEFLLLVKEIANAANVKLDIEIFPLEEGGIKQFFRFSAKEVKNGFSLAVLTAVLTTFLTNPIAKITEKWIDEMFADKELVELQKENLRRQNKKLESETEVLDLDKELKLIELEKNKKALIHKSRFYKILYENPKVEKVSIKATGPQNRLIFPEREVVDLNFPEYIIDSNELPDIYDENAEIEIISPVLKSGSYKWRGYYDNTPISFGMKSKEFKQKILTGEINFKNGFTITCALRIRRFLDEDGIEKIKDYTVTRVDSYCINDTPIETSEGKKRRIAIENEDAQLNLPFADDSVEVSGKNTL